MQASSLRLGGWGLLAYALASCALETEAPTGQEEGEEVSVSVEALTPPESNCTQADSGGRKYFFCRTDKSWSAAQAKCKLLLHDFDLAAIQTSGEKEFIRTHLVADSWIGGSDIALESTWRWAQTGAQFWQGTAGGSSSGAYTNWLTGQPNNTSNQDCLQMEDDGTGKWSDESCSLTRDYVCEGDACESDNNKTEPGQCGCGSPDTDSDDDGTADCVDDCDDDADKSVVGECGCGFPETDSDDDGTPDCVDRCPADDQRSEVPCSPDTDCEHATFEGHSYFFCDNQRSWSLAKTNCAAVGMKLARIDTDAENDFIDDEIASDRWIGGSDSGSEGAWHWEIAGERFWQGTAGGAAIGGLFTNWGSGQPNNQASGAGEDCLQIGSTGAWRDDTCSDTEQYICEEVDVCGGCEGTGDPCTTSFCDEPSATCLTVPNEGAACDDGDPSTSDEICAAGVCVPSPTTSSLDDHCAATANFYAERLRSDPDYAVARQQIAQETASWQLRCSGDSIDSSCSPVFRLPVVVHVVGDATVQAAVTDAQINAQIAQLNKDYRQMGGVVPDVFSSVDADMELEFALAKRDPSCAATTGITRTTNPTGTVWCIRPDDCPTGDINAIMRSASSAGQGHAGTQNGADPWNAAGYINIWVTDVAVINGRATWPGEPPETDGVIIDYLAFGPQAPGEFHLGHTLSHELGHYFNLFHTFQTFTEGAGCTGSGPAGGPDGCDVAGDLVCDTPPQGNFEDGNKHQCPDPSDPSEFLDACFIEVPDLPEMSMNFMDYTDDDCSTMFTAGQKLRLGAAINLHRSGLKNSAGLIPPPTGNFDLWLADGKDDLGNQPNTETERMWKSPDIWVRQRHDEANNQEHQNPVFPNPGTPPNGGHNHVYVNVRNRGCMPSVPTYVNMFWAKASSSLSWPAPWDGSETVPGTSTPMGGPVEDAAGNSFQEIPVLEPGGSAGDWTVVKFDWFVPDPADYASIGGNESHFCLLALIDPCRSSNFDGDHHLNLAGQNACADVDSDGWPGRFSKEGDVDNPLIADRLSTNVRNQNNMAWKNVTVVNPADANGVNTAFAGLGGTPDGIDALVKFVEPEDSIGRDSIFDWGTIFVDLGPELYDRWEEGDFLGSDVQPAGGTEVEILASGATIDGIPLDPADRFTIMARFVPSAASESLPARTHPDSYFIDLEQYAKRPGGDEIVGGVQFVLKTYRPVAPVQAPD